MSSNLVGPHAGSTRSSDARTILPDREILGLIVAVVLLL